MQIKLHKHETYENFSLHDKALLPNKTPVEISVIKQNKRSNNEEKTYLELSEKFINLLMMHGKKSKAYNIFYKALKSLYFKNMCFLIKNQKNVNFYIYKNKTSLQYFFATKLVSRAVRNVSPSIETKNVKIAGKTYQVPCIISAKRQNILAIRWIIDSARKKKKTSSISFHECLSAELFQALQKSGKPIQKKHELHKLAESNRGYSKFKWW